MRPVDRGDAPTDNNGNAIEFTHYSDARDHLIARIGDYCSYCEVALHSTIHVEHVRPKSKHAELELAWTNFLLACDYCNPTKGDEDVVLDDFFWPDTDNTARPFIYLMDRAPQVGPGLTEEEQLMAARTLRLTGLDREPGAPDPPTLKDRRWLKRREAWGVALNEFRKIQQTDTPQQRDSAVHVALARGFWSVWMQVFEGDVDMRRRLIAAFQGSSAQCFDDQTRPVFRHGGKI